MGIVARCAVSAWSQCCTAEGGPPRLHPPPPRPARFGPGDESVSGRQRSYRTSVAQDSPCCCLRVRVHCVQCPDIVWPRTEDQMHIDDDIVETLHCAAVAACQTGKDESDE